MRLAAFLFLLHTAAAATAVTVSINGQCGTDGVVCPEGSCCSQYNYCGTTPEHCAVGCQIGFGHCHIAQKQSPSSLAPPSPTSESKKRPAPPSSEASSKKKPTSSTSSNTAPAPTKTNKKRPATATKSAPLPPSKKKKLAPSTLKKSAKIDVVTECTEKGTIAVTYDDGPYKHTVKIAKMFEMAGGRVTFFVNGDNYNCIYDHAEALRTVFAAGHQIASHTYAHLNLTSTTITKARIVAEEIKLQTAFRKIIGAVPVYMRPPFGAYNDTVVGIMQMLGYTKVVNWDIDSGDSQGLKIDQQKANYNKATLGTSHITLHHETLEDSVKMVPFVINWAKKNHLKMVTVAECLGDSYLYRDVTTPETKNPSWTC